MTVNRPFCGTTTNGAVYLAIRRIPEGTVATYGQISELAGVGPRQPGKAMISKALWS